MGCHKFLRNSSGKQSSLTVHAVQEVQIAEQEPIGMNFPGKTPTFFPNRVAEAIAKEFDNNHPQPNPNRSRLSAAAKTLTDCLQQPRHSPLGLRQKEDQTKDVSLEGDLSLDTTS